MGRRRRRKSSSTAKSPERKRRRRRRKAKDKKKKKKRKTIRTARKIAQTGEPGNVGRRKRSEKLTLLQTPATWKMQKKAIEVQVHWPRGRKKAKRRKRRLLLRQVMKTAKTESPLANRMPRMLAVVNMVGKKRKPIKRK